MKVTALTIPDVLMFTPRVFSDARGFFYESFNQQQFNQRLGREITFVQDNHSYSTRGVLRGLHYQLPPKAQGKLVRVVAGVVYDVSVDLRRDSPYFGQWVGAVLSAENKRQLWMPPGFAHGFVTLSEEAELLYKTTDSYAPTLERSIRWNDPALKIDWQFTGAPLLAAKDESAPLFADAELPPV